MFLFIFGAPNYYYINQIKFIFISKNRLLLYIRNDHGDNENELVLVRVDPPTSYLSFINIKIVYFN